MLSEENPFLSSLESRREPAGNQTSLSVRRAHNLRSAPRNDRPEHTTGPSFPRCRSSSNHHGERQIRLLQRQMVVARPKWQTFPAFSLCRSEYQKIHLPGIREACIVWPVHIGGLCLGSPQHDAPISQALVPTEGHPSQDHQ